MIKNTQINKSLTRLFWCIFLLLIHTGLGAETVLNLSHQWPGDTGDLRHEMAVLIQAELKKKNIGVSLNIITKKDLKMRPREQWTALTAGNVDLTIYPLAYAGPEHPLFNITLMPGIIKNHEHARRFNQSRVMKVIKKIIANAGGMVLSDVWLAGGMVSNDSCIAGPEDTKGRWMRSAGITYNQMLAKAGARISSMPSSKIQSAMHANELGGAITSSSSLVSYEIYKDAECLIAPGETAIWFMYEPILMSKASFSKLNKPQQQALLAAGKKAQEFGFIEAKKADKMLVEVYTQHGVTVKTLTLAQFKKWQDVAKESSYIQFEKEARHGEKLLSWALKVE